MVFFKIVPISKLSKLRYVSLSLLGILENSLIEEKPSSDNFTLLTLSYLLEQILRTPLLYYIFFIHKKGFNPLNRAEN